MNGAWSPCPGPVRAKFVVIWLRLGLGLIYLSSLLVSFLFAIACRVPSRPWWSGPRLRPRYAVPLRPCVVGSTWCCFWQYFIFAWHATASSQASLSSLQVLARSSSLAWHARYCLFSSLYPLRMSSTLQVLLFLLLPLSFGTCVPALSFAHSNFAFNRLLPPSHLLLLTILPLSTFLSYFVLISCMCVSALLYSLPNVHFYRSFPLCAFPPFPSYFTSVFLLPVVHVPHVILSLCNIPYC